MLLSYAKRKNTAAVDFNKLIKIRVKLIIVSELIIANNNLLANKWHDADTREYVLTRESFSGDAVSERLGIVSAWFAEMSHEQRNVSLELALGLATEISN